MLFKMERTEERRRFLRRGFNTYLATCFTGGVMGTSCIETHKSKAHGTFDGESTSFQTQFPAMGSLLKVLWEDEGATRSEVLERAQKIDLGARQVAEHWNSVLSDYDDDSESSRVTSAADDLEWHNVSSDFTAILNEADHWYQLSEGAFDVALGAMTRLRRRRRIPSQEVWAKAKDRVGWHHVDWDRVQSRLRLKRSGVRFDFGAIGKGWVADRIYDLLIATGIQRCLVNFAGNMRVGLPPRGKSGWPVSIDAILEGDSERGPDELVRLSLSQCGISTSGDRWQRLPDASSQASGRKTSHILDPRIGLGISAPQSVTIIASNATRADAASTASSVHLNGNRSHWLDRLVKSSDEYRWIIQFVEDERIHLLQRLQ
jgi:thiamine biosynthesis lipoprotein